jgi:pimeloyl-ACP methyl ester carboxylesterase
MKSKKIYILHGWAYTTEKWEPFIEALENKGLEVVLLKIPGLTTPLGKVWKLDDYVNWLESELATEVEKVVLLGHSNGGRICLSFAAKYPEKVKGMILIDSAGIYHNELPIKIKRLVFGGLARFGRKISNSEMARKLLYKMTRESDYERANPLLRMTMRNLITTDVSDLFHLIRLPVVIIWGEKDFITPLKDGRLMKNALVNSELFVISGAKHSPMFTHVEEVIKIVVNKYGDF